MELRLRARLREVFFLLSALSLELEVVFVSFALRLELEVVFVCFVQFANLNETTKNSNEKQKKLTSDTQGITYFTANRNLEPCYVSFASTIEMK